MSPLWQTRCRTQAAWVHGTAREKRRQGAALQGPPARGDVGADIDELELVRQAVAGDRSALSQLLLLHYDGLQRHLTGKIPAELQGLLRPEDVLHQTLIRVAQAIGTFEPRHAGAFRGWLETIADNLLKDAAKRRRRERRAGEAVRGERAPDDSSMAALVERIATDSSTPAGQAQRRESMRRVQAALAALPAEQREVVQRYYLQGQSYEQIAAATGRTKDAVRGISYRARKNLREIMGRSSLYFSG
ncbi:MAG TPA: RNA polymerase sigma factor [Candidatus Anammoximicrobium sp.]|nr:RNA polymerase sigma factor [Candidatus Anammoximicrobium sp.]